MRHWEYFKYVIRHKWFVFWAGLSLGVPIWRLIIHDWDKFMPSMWGAYARCFYTIEGTKQYKPDDDFWRTWNGHQKRNRHHWQYYVLIKDGGELELLPMLDADRREMLADWTGAGRALGKPFIWRWYDENRDKIMIHPDTRQWLEAKLKEMEELERIRRMLGM